MLLLLAACTKAPADTALVGEGLFEQGCPVAGESVARTLVSDTERPWGTDATARAGDVLLMNRHAAWVIQDVAAPQTYVHYGGNVIDAVPVDGCEQAAGESFGEVGYLVGELFLDDYTASSIRMFRGESVEIVSDGSDGGDAVVEVHGVDDRFWLVELTLLRGDYVDGGDKRPSEPYGMDMTVRYTLSPDSPVLTTELLVEGTSQAAGGEYMLGMVMFPSDHTDEVAFAGSEFSVAGISMDLDVPWVAHSDGQAAHAVSYPETNLASTGIAGVSVLVDAGLALDPVQIGPGNTMSTTVAYSVAAGDTSDASCLLAELPTRVDGQVLGDVTDVVVEVWATNIAGDLDRLDRIAVGEDGSFGTWLDDRGGDWSLRVVGEGRRDGDLVPVTPGETGIELTAPDVGYLTVAATVDGDPSAARVQLSGPDRRVLYVTPDLPTWPVPPGEYDVVITRGWETSAWSGTVVVEGDTSLSAAMETVVDTTGWISIDSHIHSQPSADSSVLPEDRARTVAAAGLDAIVTTDHEAIVDLGWAPEAVGDDAHFVLGSEVTATIPEHTNAWPFPVREDHSRGAPVEWVGEGFPGIFDNTRERGAEVIQLNHFRKNGECGILCVLDWDRQGEPGMDDPSRFLIEGGVWSWDFDAAEIQNGFRSPFLDPANPRTTGAFEDWMAFHNLGHRVTGMAVTDAHGLELPGSPRTYLRGTADDDGIVAATLGGHAVMSMGAFADVSIGEAGPGDLATPGDLSIRVQALPEIDVTEVLVLVNCALVATLEAPTPDEVVKLDEVVALDLAQDAHVVVLGFGDGAMPDGFDASYDASGTPRFIANPIFVDVDGDGEWTEPGPQACWTR